MHVILFGQLAPSSLLLEGFLDVIVMKQANLDYCKRWFKKYVAQYYKVPGFHVVRKT
jgi:hypothetical protein